MAECEYVTLRNNNDSAIQYLKRTTAILLARVLPSACVHCTHVQPALIGCAGTEKFECNV